jgi:ATP-binding cassette subfamily B protein
MNLQMILTMLFRMPVTATISIVNAFTPPMGNTTYGLITIGIVFVMLAIVLIIGLKVLPYFDKSRKKLDATNKIMRENILGSRVIKAFGISDIQHDLYEKQNKALRYVNIRGQALFLPIMIFIQFILNAGVTVILIVAGVQFVHASNHPPINAGIFAFTQLIIIVLFSSLIAVMVIVMTVRTMPSIRRINEVINTNPLITELKSPIPLTNEYSIKFENVNFKYNKKAKAYALKNINFEIPSGQTLGIVGGTGSGKSTIANLIPRFYDVEKGQVKIGGVDVKQTKLNNIVDIVSVVLQESILFSGTIESNLKFGKEDASEKEMIKACQDACA